MATMEKIIERAMGALDVAAKKDMFIPHFIWRDCKGIAIISVVQTGFAIAVSGGDGVLVKHNDDGTWGPPSALEFGGASAGAIFGRANKQIFIFAMTDYSLSMLTSNTRYQLGVEIGLAVGPVGEEAELAATAGGRGLGTTLSYTFEDGALLNIGYENHFVGNMDVINNAFYGKEVDATDLVMKAGSVDVPKGRGIESLHQKLSAFSGVEVDVGADVEVDINKTKGEAIVKASSKKHVKKNKHSMESIVERANNALDIIADKTKFIPNFIWRDCKGVAILSVKEIGFAVAKSNGDGVLLKHNSDGSWGPPSALEFGGMSAGAIFGKGKKQIFIFPMNEYCLSLLTSNTRYQLGVEIGLAVGPNGAEVEGGVTAGGRGMGSTLTYTFENGVLLDVGCNNCFVSNDQKINNAFYGKEVSPTDIVMHAGAVDIPKVTGIEDLYKKLSVVSGKTTIAKAKVVIQEDAKPVAKQDVIPDAPKKAKKDKKKKHHKHRHHHHHTEKQDSSVSKDTDGERKKHCHHHHSSD